MKDNVFCIFDERVISFLDCLSKEIRERFKGDAEATDIRTFGFWCRKAHIMELKAKYDGFEGRYGIGTVFHNTASNVPALFAYSMTLGLLSGNSVCVRLSEKSSSQAKKLWKVIEDVLNNGQHEFLKNRVELFTCPRGDGKLKEMISEADGIVAWGGDKSIEAICEYPRKNNAIMMMFPDRFSAAIIDSETIKNASDEELKKIAHEFYNDTYAMDQNACSSPQYVIFSSCNEEVPERFWSELLKEATANYELSAFKASKKLENLTDNLMNEELCAARVRKYENYIYVTELAETPKSPERFRGAFGSFFEISGDWREILKGLSCEKLQTVTCCGVNAADVKEYAEKNGLSGIYRVVPFGQAMTMDTVWDGRDFILELSKEKHD